MLLRKKNEWKRQVSIETDCTNEITSVFEVLSCDWFYCKKRQKNVTFFSSTQLIKIKIGLIKEILFDWRYDEPAVADWDSLDRVITQTHGPAF